MCASSLNGFDIVTRHLVMEKDLNPEGHLFGGAMLAWLDEATGIYVMEKIGYPDFVTVGLDNVYFKAPGHRGDIITIYSRIVKTGASSVTAETKAVNHELHSGADREIITCRFTFVCLKEHQAYPYFKSPEYRVWQEKQRGAPARD
ncbi:MAG TPA: acyl-CoA thioesterase [Candidatus Hydrogenedentes bacterium]|nr:acyl-CoA thioesterase [Candidatus Hydrogenedentota bacterium]